MYQSSSLETSWLDLSAAARYVGVHFTTLRRWTDEGLVPCIRTPGGRRRYLIAELTEFLANSRQAPRGAARATSSSQKLSALLPPKHLGISGESWYGRLDDNTRAAMRREGQRLMAVLLQYTTRSNGGDAFLQEGQRLATSYGEECHRAGLTRVETLQAFLLVRRAINDSVHQAGALAGVPDPDTWRLYDRMTTFLDAMLIATVEGYDRVQDRALPASNLVSGQNA